MNKTQKINFEGGFIELSVSRPPVYELNEWKVKVIGKIFASNETTKAEGKRILIKKGFTTHGNVVDEYYKVIYLNFA